jgi:hypothetical protein
MSFRPSFFSNYLKDFETNDDDDKQAKLEADITKRLSSRHSRRIRKLVDANPITRKKPKVFERFKAKSFKTPESTPKKIDEREEDNNELLFINESSPEMENHTDCENPFHSNKFEKEAMKKLWSLIKVESNLALGDDFYSLAFYGFYLEEDEEELSIHKDVHTVKSLIGQQE